MSDERRKVWAAILYQESAPKNWKEILESTHVAIAVSPLHDRDIWTESDEEIDALHVAGTQKKAHWHLVMYFESLKSYQQALGVVSSLGIKYVEAVESPTAYNRYLCHLDSPEKAQYERKDIVLLNGAKCDQSKPKPTADELQVVRDAILEFVKENGITEYSELVFYALEENKEDWAFYIEHHTVYLDSLLKSIRYSRAQ